MLVGLLGRCLVLVIHRRSSPIVAPAIPFFNLIEYGNVGLFFGIPIIPPISA